MSIVKRALELRPGSALRNQIEAFISGKNLDVFYGEYLYKGKSKKLKTKVVTIISDLGEKCKVTDLEGNTTTISKSMLIKK